jgi:hypothetical protein
MKVCINCQKEITIKNKVHISPFCFFGVYECSCGIYGQLPVISKNINNDCKKYGLPDIAKDGDL